MPTFVLFESATGYSLFKAKQVETISATMSTVQKTVDDFRSFQRMVSLVSHLPFDSSEQGVVNMTAIATGELPELLATFIETHLGSGESQERGAVHLGVLDRDLARHISTRFGHVHILSDNSILELTRGIRLHFDRFLKDYSAADVSRAQLGLGHAFCRGKLKMDINKADQMVIQSSAVLEFLDRDINQCCMRIKEWYSWHFPELGTIVKDNKVYVAAVLMIGDKSGLLEDRETQLAALQHVLLPAVQEDEEAYEQPEVRAQELAESVVEAAETSMGSDMTEVDLLQVERFAEKIARMLKYRGEIVGYVNRKMHQIAPNLTHLVGEGIGSKLISRAGSLLKLAKFPSSTIQILGAEKALFRALKTRGKTPKYGILFNSSFVSKATRQNKGRMARHVANKASLCCRIDAFGKSSSTAYGEVLKRQLEQKVWFYEGHSSAPFMKNADAMVEARGMAVEQRAVEEAARQAAAVAAKAARKRRRLRKKPKVVQVGKKRPRTDPEEEPDAAALEAQEEEEEMHPRKRRKTRHTSLRRKSKKRKRLAVADPKPAADAEEGDAIDGDGDVVMDAPEAQAAPVAVPQEPVRKRRRKKKRRTAPSEATEGGEEAPAPRRRRRKKSSSSSSSGTKKKRRRRRESQTE